MNIKDRVYGEVEISEPVLLEIINCPSFQKLKDINQYGYTESYLNGVKCSRFEHSVGVCLLLKRYGAKIEEQIAGLIHDISHSAFSHVIDYVLESGSEKEQTYQDDIFNDFVKKTEIPTILEKHGFNVNYILDDSNFSLKENSLPDLCADRIDYSLRDACVFGEIKDAKYFLDNLVAERGRWVFRNFESARKYAELFFQLNAKYYSVLTMAIIFRSVGEYLKYALIKKYITESDLYTTDKIVLGKIGPHHKKDEHLQMLFDRMNNKIGFSNNPNDFEHETFCKSRAVDPLCMYNKAIKRVSEIDPNWGIILERESKPKHYFIKFER